MKKRIAWLDLVKGFAILYVLFGHTFPWGGLARDMGESYLMPMYFVVAGYTFKKIDKHKLIESTLLDAKRIMLPAIVCILLDFVGRSIVGSWSFGEGIKETLARLVWGNSYDCSFSMGVGAMWFLYAMFWSRLAYKILHILFGEKNLLRVLMLCVLTAVTHYMNLYGVFLPQYVDGVFLGCVFLEVGYIIKNYDTLYYSKKNDIAVGLGCLAFWVLVFFSMRVNMIMNSRKYTILTLFLAIAGSIWTIVLFRLIDEIKILKPIQWVGRYSLDLLCIHFLDHLMFDGIESGLKLAVIRVIVDVVLLVIFERLKICVFNTKSCPKDDTK